MVTADPADCFLHKAQQLDQATKVQIEFPHMRTLRRNAPPAILSHSLASQQDDTQCSFGLPCQR